MKYGKEIVLCTKCGQHLTRDKFNKNRNRKNGLNGWCKNCLLSWRQNNRQSANDRTKIWRQGHPIRTKNNDAKKYSGQRGLGHTVLLPNVYRGMDINYCWHHVTDNLVIAIPLTMHIKYHARNTCEHRNLLSERIETLYGINLEEMIKNEI